VTSARNVLVNGQASRVSGRLKDAQSVTSARNAVASAVASQASGKVKDAATLHSAQTAVTTAQGSLDSTVAANAVKAAPASGGDLATDRAQLVSAQAALDNAIAAQAQTTLRAPAAGTVATVNGAVGETPGTASSSSSSSSSSSGGTAFITLVDLATPEVLANFSETDAAKVRVGQPATIVVDALPEQELAAHVVSIDTTQTVVSNVVTYGVTMQLDRTTPGLKPGMTVSAAVIVAKRDGVLHVPNAAVRTTGGSSTVTVVAADGKQTTIPVTAGLQGDDATEIVSGLKAGQEVVVSTTTAQTSTTGTSNGRFGGGGFGGGGGGAIFRGP